MKSWQPPIQGLHFLQSYEKLPITKEGTCSIAALAVYCVWAGLLLDTVRLWSIQDRFSRCVHCALLQICTLCTITDLYTVHYYRCVHCAPLQMCTLCTITDVYTVHYYRSVHCTLLQMCTLYTITDVYTVHLYSLLTCTVVDRASG